MSEALPANKVDVPATTPEPDDATGEDGRSPKAMDDETFRDRYGKQTPVVGSPYRYQQIALALAIVGIGLLGLIWLVRREKRKGRALNR